MERLVRDELDKWDADAAITTTTARPPSIARSLSPLPPSATSSSSGSRPSSARSVRNAVSLYIRCTLCNLFLLLNNRAAWTNAFYITTATLYLLLQVQLNKTLILFVFKISNACSFYFRISSMRFKTTGMTTQWFYGLTNLLNIYVKIGFGQ